jgi:transposase
LEGFGLDGDGLRDDQWERLAPFVPGGRKGKRGPRSNGRRFLDALVWLARSGARWRDLPEDRFGPYQTAKRRYYRWVEQGVFDRMFAAVSCDPDFEWLSIDATVIRAQAQAAGARITRGDLRPRLSVAPGAVLEPRSTPPSMRSGCPCASSSAPASKTTWRPPAT